MSNVICVDLRPSYQAPNTYTHLKKQSDQTLETLMRLMRYSTPIHEHLSSHSVILQRESSSQIKRNSWMCICTFVTQCEFRLSSRIVFCMRKYHFYVNNKKNEIIIFLHHYNLRFSALCHLRIIFKFICILTIHFKAIFKFFQEICWITYSCRLACHCKKIIGYDNYKFVGPVSQGIKYVV